MATFLPIEDLKNLLIILKLVYTKGKGNVSQEFEQTLKFFYTVFRMCLLKS
jgi:hypothetical protein